jgi:toxin ParE1/3/4
MVIWTEHAKSQLRHIHDYIAQDSARYAKRVTEALINKSLSLAELPHHGKKVAELNDEAVREISLYSYRILYEINTTQVNVLAVVHKRRDMHPEEIGRE